MTSKTSTVTGRINTKDKADFYRLCLKFEAVLPCTVVKQLVQEKYQELKLKEMEECQKTKKT